MSTPRPTSPSTALTSEDDALFDKCECGASFIPVGQATQCSACARSARYKIDWVSKAGAERIATAFVEHEAQQRWTKTPLHFVMSTLKDIFPDCISHLTRPSGGRSVWHLTVRNGPTTIRLTWAEKGGFEVHIPSMTDPEGNYVSINTEAGVSELVLQLRTVLESGRAFE